MKKFKKNYLVKKSFIVPWPAKKLLTKYEHVLNAWNKFEMKTMKDYHNLYLKCDVLLLTYVFEKFRNNSSKKRRLCPSHYLRVPGLSWDAMLEMTKIEL